MRSKTVRGFTLLEIMIVVAIIGIIGAIAYPSYQDSVRRGRRADARAVLLEAAQFMERFATQNMTTGYADPPAPAPTAQAGLNAQRLNRSPKDGTTIYYVIALSNQAQNTFTLTATPQATGGQNKDKCGGATGPSLGLTQGGVKQVNGATTAALVQACWQ